jgi:hypothetical protein
MSNGERKFPHHARQSRRNPPAARAICCGVKTARLTTSTSMLAPTRHPWRKSATTMRHISSHSGRRSHSDDRQHPRTRACAQAGVRQREPEPPHDRNDQGRPLRHHYVRMRISSWQNETSTAMSRNRPASATVSTVPPRVPPFLGHKLAGSRYRPG